MARFVRQPDSMKWASFVNDPGVNVLTLADMDIPLFQPFREQILQRVKRVNNFTYKNVSEESYRSTIDWYQLRHLRKGVSSFTREDIVETPSILNIIFLLIDRMTVPQDRILLITPVYNLYDRISRYLGRRLQESKMLRQINGNQVRYNIDFGDFAQRATKCKIMIFCNPHNPSGRVWTEQQVSKIVAICKQNNIIIISDEILSDLIPDNHIQRFYSMANCTYPRIVVCNSISKAFNLESLRAGYAIIRGQSLRKKYTEIAQMLNLNNNQLGMMCTEICYSKVGLQWLEYCLPIISHNFRYLLERIKGTRLLVSQLEAAYIITINFEQYLRHIVKWSSRQLERVNGKHVVSFFLREKGIRAIEMVYGNAEGVLTDIRLTIAIETDLFVLFADKLRVIINELELQDSNIDAKL